MRRNGGKKRIEQFTKDGKFIQEFDSILEATRKTNIPKSTISISLIKNTEAGGFNWKYKE